MKITYNSNNSGGRWWLKDEDWFNLEKAGWNVHWIKDEKNDMLKLFNEGDRFLGALANKADKKFNNLKECILEFENITGLDVSKEGCSCCGAPHSFEWTNDDGACGYASGEDCLKYMYDNVPSSLREACE